MRIVIEIEPSDLRPSVTLEGADEQALPTKATDAGGPPEYLVEVLKEEPGPEQDVIEHHMIDEDAGSGPAWNSEAIETIVSLLMPEGNGHSEGGPAPR
jgi:hypothetical protein